MLCQVLDAGPLPGRLPVLLSAVELLPSLLCAVSVLGSVGLLPHSMTPLLRRKATTLNDTTTEKKG